MTTETLERHAKLAFDLMCSLRADQTSPAYIHAAKAWMHLDSEFSKALKKAKTKSAKDITEAQVDELAKAAGLAKTTKK